MKKFLAIVQIKGDAWVFCLKVSLALCDLVAALD